MGIDRVCRNASATFLVAASNSSAKDRAAADIVCDGTADQTEINNVINTIRLAGIGGDVVLAPGEYNISGKIIIDCSFVTLRGRTSPSWGGYNRAWNGSLGTGDEGSAGAKINASTSGFNLISLEVSNIPDGGESRHRGIYIQDLYLYGAGDSKGINNLTAGAYHDMCRIENLMIQNVDDAIDVGFDAGIIRDCNIQDCSGSGIKLAGVNSFVGPNNVVFDIGGPGITVTGNQIKVHNNLIGDTGDSLSDTAIFLNGVSWCTVSDNTLSNTGGIVTTGGAGHTITGNSIRAGLIGIRIGQTTRTTNVTVTGNTLQNDSATANWAIEFVGSSYGTATGNTIYGGGWANGAAATIKWNGACTVENNNGDVSFESLPTLSTGTVLGWYRADYMLVRTGATDASAPGTWYDTSGNARDATAGDAPSFRRLIKNNKPAMRFDGSNDYFNKTGWPAVAQPYTFIVVAKQSSTAGTQTVVGANGGNASMYLSGGNVGLYAGSPVAGTAITGTNWNIITGVFNGASSKTSINNGSYTTVNAGTAVGSTNFTIGANGGLGSEFFAGDIVEVVAIQGAITDADRTLIHQVLGLKYGITIS